MERIKSIVIIDDDPIYSFIIKQHIKYIDPACKVFSFLQASEGYLFLHKNENKEIKIVLQDLNMPGVNDWEHIEDICRLPWSIHRDIRLYVVTNSVAISDIEKAKLFPLVQRLLLKPIEQDLLRKLLNYPDAQLEVRVGF